MTSTTRLILYVTIFALVWCAVGFGFGLSARAAAPWHQHLWHQTPVIANDTIKPPKQNVSSNKEVKETVDKETQLKYLLEELKRLLEELQEARR